MIDLKLELEISEDDLDRMEAEVNKPYMPQATHELQLGNEELVLPDFPR